MFTPRATHENRILMMTPRAFALNLIERWIVDPSNVRLLRIGLDIWPAADVLEDVIEKLRTVYSIRGEMRSAPAGGLVLPRGTLAGGRDGNRLRRR